MYSIGLASIEDAFAANDGIRESARDLASIEDAFAGNESARDLTSPMYSAKTSAREADDERAVLTGRIGRSSSLETDTMSEDIGMSTAVQDSSESRAFRDRAILPT